MMRRTRVITIAAVATSALALGGGVAFASIPDGSGTVHACYATPVPSGGTPLDVIDTDAGGSCPSGYTELTWAQGAQTVQESTEEDAGPNSYTTALASCPSGYQMTGGGFSADPGSGLQVEQSAPISTGWRVEVQNPSETDTYPFVSYVICANAGGAD